MGIASSTQQAPEGEHFNLLVNPNKGKEPGCKIIKINNRARILKYVSFDTLWNNFINGSSASFALTQSEASSLLLDCIVGDNNVSNKIDTKSVEEDIKDFIMLVEELSVGDMSKTIDFMSLCSSILFLSEISIEVKADQIFSWISLDPSISAFNFDDFFVAMKSFERGLSHAMGMPSCSEIFVRNVATQWMALADFQHKGYTDSHTRISSNHFFEFCTNRQHVVRRLLEALAAMPLQQDQHADAKEVIDTVDTKFLKGPGGGDEWMANPAWKKTAERMVPAHVKAAACNVKPNSGLELDWVHGYRGFDCRNNIGYVNRVGTQVAFPAAALGIVQDNNAQDAPGGRRQTYFGEHGDDVLSMATAPLSCGGSLLASGEIGKKPAIYLYKWVPAGSDGQSGSFESLCCMSGYHTRGVVQLVFSLDGKLLFSVGVEYTVSVYCTDSTNKTFGKIIASSQGPKSSKVMHAALYGSQGRGSTAAFITCGEKHAVTWELDRGTLNFTECKLGANRNKLVLSAAQVVDGMAVMGTADGDLLTVAAKSKVVPAVLHGSSGHGKNSINAIWSSAAGDALVTGDRSGKIVVWQVSGVSTKEGATASLTACAEFMLTGFNQTTLVKGGLNMTPGGVLPSSAGKAKNAAVKGGALDRKTPKSSAGRTRPASIASKRAGGKIPGKAETGSTDKEEDEEEEGGSVPAVRAVALSEDFTRLLVGTQTCEILEYVLPGRLAFTSSDAAAVDPSAFTVSQLVCGHFRHEVWGLAVRPPVIDSQSGSEDGEYCTVGDDGFLRVWNLRQHKQMCCIELPGMARTCDYSPDGLYLAVGFGGRVGKKNSAGVDGMVKIFRFERSDSKVPSFTQVGEIKDAKQWISCVRFSPDGCTLAVGSRDNSVYLYSVMHQYERRGKFSKHNSGISQLDFSFDGKYIQSNCSAYEILFSDAQTGAQVSDGATRLLDAEWASWTCTLGWPVIGIWSGSMDGSDVNSVHRSPTGRLLATSDDFGKVNVFRYPAVRDGGSEHISYSGHSSHVTCVRWVSLGHVRSPRDDFLISLGGEDKCVFQWRNTDSDADVAKSSIAHSKLMNAGPVSPSSIRLDNSSEEVVEFMPPSGGDEFMAVKPWLGAIVAPSAWSSPDPSKVDPLFAALGELSAQHRRLADEGSIVMGVPGEAVPTVYTDVHRAAQNTLSKIQECGVSNPAAPDTDELELDWVHGYNGFDCRNNVFYVESKKSNAAPSNTAARSVLYFAAALGILLDPIERSQRYFRGHTDDIVSMAVHKGGSCDDNADAVVATGQLGIGSIFLWEAPSMKTLAVIKPKQKNVHLLAFSPDGRRLVSMSEDSQVAVSDWKSQTILSITKGEPAPTLHLAVGHSTNSVSFLSCGDKHMRIWTLNGRNLTAAKVITSSCPGAKIQLYLCAGEVHGKYLVGCEDGAIYVVPAEGKGVKCLFEHHPSAAKAKLGKKGASITSMHVQTGSSECLLFTGAKNGTVVVWDASELAAKDKPTKRYTLDVFGLGVPGLVAKQVQAMCMFTGQERLREQGEKPLLLVATRGCDILEVVCDLDKSCAELYKGGDCKDRSSGVLMQGHCNHELWGVATHPTKPEFCTVGDDKSLRFYNVHSRGVIAFVALGTMARACDYSPDGSMLAVGFGGRVGRGKEKGGGMLRLYSADPHASKGVQKLAECCNAKEWISDVKFSSDGHTLAVGAHDCKIYIYDVSLNGTNATLKLRSTFAKHNSVINHLDLSSDGRFMQSNCSAYELLFCDTTTGRQITSATELRDVKWASWTCTLGWPVQGIWAAGMDGSDINAVARSHSGHLLASSDDLGRVNLFRYPADQTGAASVGYAAHSSHVMNVRWTVGDEFLLSCGGNDKCLMQWRHSMADVGGAANASGSSEFGAGADEDFEGNAESSNALLELLEGPSGGDEAGAVKPWLGAIRAPKNPPPVSGAAPNAQLDLQWVHGYTSASAGARNMKISNNLFYNAENCPVFPAAALAVQLNTAESEYGRDGHAVQSNGKNDSRAHFKQKYFVGHDDDILCLAISKNRRFIATGQIASKTSKGKGSVIVWDAAQCRLLCRMEGCHQRAVTSLAFSPDGTQLVSVGQDDSNTHILWEDKGGSWSKAVQIAISKGDKAPVLFTHWTHPNSPMAANADCHFLSGGAAGVNFWKLQGSTLSKKQGRFNKKFKKAPLLCAANLQGKDSWRMVVGTAAGDLYVYGGREVCDAAEDAHHGPVLCLTEGGEDCLFLISGGRDHVVKLWNQALQPISVFDVTPFSCVDASVASLDIRPVDPQSPSALTLLVGTYGGEIIEVSSGKGESGGKKGAGGSSDDPRNLDLSHASATVLQHSHYGGELWGLAPHPIDPDVFATVGDDKTLRIWSIKRNSMLKAVPLYWPARCVAWHPSGAVLAVGFHEATKGGYKSKKAKKSSVMASRGNKETMKSKVPQNANKRNAAVADDKDNVDGDDLYDDEGAESAGGLDTTHKGAIHLYSFVHQPGTSKVDIKKRADGCTSMAWINDIKFSPEDGTLLLAGSHDKRLYAFALPELRQDASDEGQWTTWAHCLDRPKYEFNKHSSAVLHVDFTQDGKYFQTNCQASELLFGHPESGRQETSASRVADYNGDLEDDAELERRQWATQTCKLGWAVQGIWAPGMDTTDINAVDRSFDHKLLATADDFGHVKLFRFPCAQEHSKFLRFDGHSSHVTNVRWTLDNHLISVGGNDKCTFVWSMSEN